MNKVNYLSVVILVTMLVTSTATAELFPVEGQIMGIITTSDGEVISESLVTAEKTEKGEEFTTTTDSNGGFVLDVPPGTYKLSYTYDGKTYKHKNVIVADGLTSSIDIQIPTESSDTDTLKYLEIMAPDTANVSEEVTIKVIDRDSEEPVNDSEVYISNFSDSKSKGKTEVSLVVDNGELLGLTDENGEITHTFNESGKYMIAATKDEYESDLHLIAINSEDQDQDGEPPVKGPKRNTKFNVINNSITGYSVRETEFLSNIYLDDNISTGKKTGVKSRFETEKLMMSSHNNANGLLKLKAKEYTNVTIELNESAIIEKVSDKKVTIKSDEKEGTLMIAGHGKISVDNATITVELERNGQLIFKAYPGQKDQGDEEIEDGITDGNLTAEVKVSEDGENETDSVEYTDEIEITYINATGDEISITVNSSTEDGKAVVITIDNSELPADLEDLTIMIDGEEAVEVSTTDELYAPSNESKYMISEGMEDTKVFVYVNHFSQRIITIGEDKDTPTDELESKLPTEAQVPTDVQKGVLVGLVAVFAIAGFIAVAYLMGRRK